VFLTIWLVPAPSESAPRIKVFLGIPVIGRIRVSID